MSAPRPVRPPPPPGGARALLAGTAASLLLFSTALAEGFGLPKLVGLAAGAAAAWGALALASARGAPVRRATPLDRPLAVCALVLAASALAGPDRILSLVGVYSLYSDGLFAFALCALVFLAAAWSDLPGRPEAAGDLLAGCAAAAGAYAALQIAGLDPFSWFRALPTGRAGSTLGDPVLLGAALALGSPLALTAAASQSPARRAFGVLSAGAAALGLWACGSRGAWLAAAAGAGTWAFLHAVGRPGARRLGAMSALGALVLGGGLLASRRDTARSDSARLALWRTVPAIVRERPLLGAGPARFQAAMRRHRTAEFVRINGPRSTQVDAHNDLLHAAATTGLLGLAAWLWLQWGALGLVRAALSDPARRAAAAGAAGAFAAAFVQAKVNPLPLGAFAAAALLAGSLAHGERRPVRAALPALGAALAAAVLVFSLRLAAADARFAEARRQAARGRGREAVAAFESALAANPWELFYRLEYARLLYAAAASAGGSDAVRLLARAAEQGSAAAARRPAEADGWAMLGAYLIAFKQAGGADRLAEARAALETARRLDPFAPAVNDNLALLSSGAAR